MYALAGIEKYINMKIPVAAVSDDILVEDKSRGIRIQLSTWDEDGNETGFQPPRGRPGSRDGRGGRDGRSPHGRGDPRDSRRGSRPESGPDRRPDSRGEPRPASRAPVPRSPQERPVEARPARAEHQQRGKHLTAEERLAHYRQKYGESFEPTPELLERLRREEQRAKEHAKPDHGGNRSGRQGGNRSSGGERRQGQDGNRQAQGERGRGDGRQNGSARRPVTGKPASVQAAAPVAGAVQEKSKPQGGILGWIKGLLRGKKQP